VNAPALGELHQGSVIAFLVLPCPLVASAHWQSPSHQSSSRRSATVCGDASNTRLRRRIPGKPTASNVYLMSCQVIQSGLCGDVSGKGRRSIGRVANSAQARRGRPKREASRRASRILVSNCMVRSRRRPLSVVTKILLGPLEIPMGHQIGGRGAEGLHASGSAAFQRLVTYTGCPSLSAIVVREKETRLDAFAHTPCGQGPDRRSAVVVQRLAVLCVAAA